MENIKLWDWVVWSKIFRWKINDYFMSSKKIVFFLCMYKMYLISAEGYKNAQVDFLTIKTTSQIWVSMKDVGSGMAVKNISDLLLKEISGICEKKNSAEKQVQKYKMTKSIFPRQLNQISLKNIIQKTTFPSILCQNNKRNFI